MGKHIHEVWHDFCASIDFTKYKGNTYELTLAIEKWAKKYPDDVFISRCDDSYFATSRIVLIVHRSKKEFFGTSMVILPQISGEPLTMFLYPSHSKELIENLEKGLKYEKRKD